MPDFTDNGASNFIKYGNDYYATSETNYIRMIDPVTLETKDKVRRPCSTAGTTRAHAGGWFGSRESWFLASISTGRLHEVPGGEPGLVPPPLRQGGQRVQLWNFHSGEGQDQIRAVQGSRRCSKRYLLPRLGLLWPITS